MHMDRSFLAFKHFLLRIINGPENPQPAREPAARPQRPALREHGADLREDWTRIEY